MIELLGAEGEQPRVYFEIVTGTHSSGKTSVVDSFGDPDLTQQLGLGTPVDCPYTPRYAVGLLQVQVGGEPYNLPVITCEEAATRYAYQRGQPELVTTGYGFGHQIMMEHKAMEMVLDAYTIARRAALAYPAIPRLGNCALILSDRFTADGAAYSALRLPERDQENIDYNEVEDAVLGWRTHPTGQRILPIRGLFREFVRQYCDMVFMADHREVALENNGLRDSSLAFREAVARRIAQIYRHGIGLPLMPLLQGSVEQRKETIRQWTERILRSDYETAGHAC